MPNQYENCRLDESSGGSANGCVWQESRGCTHVRYWIAFFDPLVLIRCWERKKRSFALTAFLNTSNSLQNCEADIRIPLETLDLQAIHREAIQKCFRFPRPDWIVEFIEGKHGAFRHPRNKMFKRHLCRLV